MTADRATNQLGRLAAACVRDFDSFRAPLSPEELAKRRAVDLTARQEELLVEWGYPYVFDEFEMLAPGRLSATEYDTFVRDTVNFLDYVSEPTQVQRRALGIWVVLFLLLFTWLTWLLKKEYWKDVH